MARPPSLEISTVDSTSLLFAGLDLFEPKPENMDFMDIDQVMDVPDTPDRLTSRQKISLNVSGDAANGDLLNRGILNGLRGSRRLNTNNGNSKNSYSRRQRDLDDHNEIKHGSSLIDSAADSASVSDGFDESTMRLADQISKRNETKLSAQTQHTESAPYQNKPLLRIPSSSQWSTDHLVDRSKLCSSTSDINGSSASDVKIHGGNRGRKIGLSQKIPSDSFFPTKIRDARRRMLPCHGNSSSEKDLCTEIPPRSFTWQDADHVLDSSERHEYTGKPERPCSIGRFEKVGAKEVDTGSVISSGSIRESRSKSQATHGLFPLYDADNYSKASGNARKRETDGTLDGAGVSINHVNVNAELMGNDKGKGIDLFHKPPPKTAQSASISLTVASPRKTGQRRLVRNGCISPYNIAKSKSTSDYGRNARDDKQDENDKRTCNDLPDGNSSCQVHIISPGSEGNQIDKMKGKGIVNEHMPENDCDARTKSLSSRNFSIPREKDSGIGDDAIDDIFRSAEEIGGWRNTRNLLKAAYLPSSHDIGGHSTINNGGCDSFNQSHGGKMEDGNYLTEVNASPEFDFHKDGDPIILQHVGPNTRLVQASSSVISESNPENNERQKGKQKLMKRQRKTPASCNNLGECSSLTFDGPEVSFVRSSGQPSNVKPSNVKPTRTRNSQRRGNLIPVIEVDEPCSPEAIFIDQQDAGRLVNDDSGTRARQVEADEILARQLQEQFYSESPGMEGGEMDASLAWTLQHDEDAQRLTSIGNRHLLHPRDSSVGHSYRGHSSQSFPSSSARPTNRAPAYTSRRMQQLRRNFYGHSPAASSRGRNFQFPPHMNLETRIDFLEALEAAVANRNSATMASHFFQVQRDFNENDYEMLLALDDDNHQHVGASLNQINSLPESTIQTDNFEEACAICLETPSTGDTIRHLPCLHKFHKEVETYHLCKHEIGLLLWRNDHLKPVALH
ncbi:uncharacterized protein LOC131245696 isoform X2 [Magnolia sinica]|uniref:uncharacterized protein LOC131245696 isoform X2 n=1 Tax=Magnolia sinica TaxID=86752 RepID=UPI00265A53F0|nr:uncharacterized protein LOC131245696 isoform X2 [Magnolia sinica]